MPTRNSSTRTGSRFDRRWLPVAGLSILALAAIITAHAALTPPATVSGTVSAISEVKFTDTPLLTPAPAPEPIVAFIGDSYTHGTGASDHAHRWTTLVSAAEGWSEVNLGLGGTGFLTSAGLNGCGKDYCSTYEERVAANTVPDAVTYVVAGGQNDYAAWATNEAGVTATINRTYANLRALHPKAKIIAVGPSVIGSVTRSASGMDAAVRTAAASVGAQYISLISPNVLTADMATGQGGHVTDVGHQAIATAVLAALG